MPKGVIKNTEKKLSKKAEAARRANKKAIAEISEDTVFARVESNLGAGGFRMVMNNGGEAIGIPRGLFNRSTMHIDRNAVVLCSPAEHNSAARVQTYEIIGVLSRKDAQALWKSKKISGSVWFSAEDKEEQEKDDYFEYDDDDNDEEVDIDAI